jgi:hypothetical protein
MKPLGHYLSQNPPTDSAKEAKEKVGSLGVFFADIAASAHALRTAGRSFQIGVNSV